MAELIKDIIVRPELRPCYVDGTPALFHKWIVEDKSILIFNSMIAPKQKESYIKKFKKDGTVPPACGVKNIRMNFALVEFEDGRIEQVETTAIKFCDSEELFHDYELCGYEEEDTE